MRLTGLSADEDYGNTILLAAAHAPTLPTRLQHGCGRAGGVFSFPAFSG